MISLGVALLCWFLLAIAVALIVGPILRRRGSVAPTCPGCRDLARQLAAAKEHVRLLERANAGLAAKVDDLLAQRRGVA